MIIIQSPLREIKSFVWIITETITSYLHRSFHLLSLPIISCQNWTDCAQSLILARFICTVTWIVVFQETLQGPSTFHKVTHSLSVCLPRHMGNVHGRSLDALSTLETRQIALRRRREECGSLLFSLSKYCPDLGFLLRRETQSVKCYLEECRSLPIQSRNVAPRVVVHQTVNRHSAGS